MNKFAKTLSASDKSIKEARAEMLAKSTVLEVDAKVSSLQREVNTLENKIISLTDLAPDNTYSLRPGGKDYNPIKWVDELHSTKIELKLKKIELEVAQEIKSEWFTEEATIKA